MTGLTKRYGDTVAVNNLSFTLRYGQVLALLGRNGAGKTTTVEILEGFRSADSGRVHVLGLDPITQARALTSKIGVMLQSGGLYPNIRPLEAMRLFATFYPNPDDPWRLLQRVGLDASETTPYRRLSGGQKQRLSLALSLIGRPELLFLDEPTAGLDPQARRDTWRLIRDLRDAGSSILLTTHYIEEAEQLADQVIIMDHGRKIVSGSPHELVHLDDTPFVWMSAVPGLSLETLSALPSCHHVRTDAPGEYRFETDNPRTLLVELTRWLQAQEITPRAIKVGDNSLEEVFLHLTEPQS